MLFERISRARPVSCAHVTRGPASLCPLCPVGRLTQAQIPGESAGVPDQGDPVVDRRRALPPLAARLAKEAVAFGLDGSLREAANADLYRFMALELTEDKKEAHQAWRERR